MKKILCAAALMVSVGSAYAQLYVRANIGYNLPANGQSLGANTHERYDETSQQYVYTYEAVEGSFGSGLSIQLGVGASINGALGYDVEIGYLVGKKNSFEDSEEGYYSYKTETSSSSFQVAPSLTFTAGTGKIQPYTRVGPVIGFTKLTSKETETYIPYDFNTENETEYSGGMSIGFKGVLGVTFNADKKVQFFGEASFISMSYAPKQSELTALREDGEDILNSVPKEDRIKKYKDKVSGDYDDVINTQLREKYSMGSIGIQVGVRYVLK